jgi:hypothetical protein
MEGTTQAGEELWGKRGKAFDALFRYSIPQGHDTCLFELKRKKGEGNAWREYSDELQSRALQRRRRKRE